MKKEKVGIVEGLGRRLSLQSTVGGGELREVGSVVRVPCVVLRVACSRLRCASAQQAVLGGWHESFHSFTSFHLKASGFGWRKEIQGSRSQAAQVG